MSNYIYQTASPKHDCDKECYEVWVNNRDYNLIKCSVCERITKFRFKNTWRQLKSILWDGISNDKKIYKETIEKETKKPLDKGSSSN